MTPTPEVSRKSRENLHKEAPRPPPLVVGLVGEGINEPPNSQGWNQCGINTHTQGGKAELNLNDIQANRNMPLLLGNAVRKDKASKS